MITETGSLASIESAVAERYRHISMRPIRRRQAPARFAHRAVPGTGLRVATLAFGAEILATTDEPIDFIPLLIPLAGHARIRCGGFRFESNPLRGVAPGPTDPLQLQTSADWKQLIVSLDRDSTERRLATLIGHAPCRPLILEPLVDLTTPGGRRIKSMVTFLRNEVRDENSLLMQGATAREVTDLLTTTVLLAQPHNFTEKLTQPSDTGSRRALRLAREFMEANQHRAVTIEDLAAATKVSARTLHRAFQRELGTTPMTYHRTLRLDAARRDLQFGSADESVATIAMRWGFTHLGKFSALYRSRFGELPSETRRRPVDQATANGER